MNPDQNKMFEKIISVNDEKNDLSWWWNEIVQKLGLSEYKKLGIPQTNTYNLNGRVLQYIYDEESLYRNDYDALCADINEDIKATKSYPCFIKTGKTSMKWDWEKTCYVADYESLENNIKNLFYESALRGAPASRIVAVREFIETKNLFYAFDGNMPIKREYRVFIKEGEIQCIHWYWQEDAFENEDKCYELEQIISKNKELSEDELKSLTESVEILCKVFPANFWTLDFMLDINNKWRFIDMAMGQNSWHPKCKFNKEVNQ